MGYDLKPRNKNIDEFCFGSFSWGWLMQSGVGLAIGITRGLRTFSYYYTPDKKGRDPNCNDGYYVTSKQAKLMSVLCNSIVSGERKIAIDWESIPENEKKYLEDKGSAPVREDFVDKAERFAEWAKKCGGFWIY